MKVGLDLLKDSIDCFSFYRSSLNSQMRAAYDNIREAVLNYNDSVRIHGLSLEQIQIVYEVLKRDCPWMFYVDKLSYEKYLLANTALVKPVYRIDRATTNAYLTSIHSRMEPMLTSWSRLDLKEAEKQVHDYFSRNIKYDKTPTIWSFECLGPLLYNNGVCEGISRAVKYIFDLLHIPTIVVHGRVRNQNVNSQMLFANIDGHTWNLVMLDQYYYHLDMTFDISIQSNSIIRYDYFNLSDDEISVDHELPSDFQLPKCTRKSQYYESLGMYMDKPQDFYVYISNCLIKRMNDIVFQVPYTKEFEKVKKNVLSLIKKCLSEKLSKVVMYHLYFNPSRCVFHLCMHY